MIDVLVNGVSLELANPNIRIEKSFGIETDVAFQKNYSFPFSLSQSKKNLAALNYTSIGYTHDRTKSFACVIKICGVDYASGVLKIIGFNENEIRCNLNWGVAALPVMDKNLRDIDFGIDENITTPFTTGLNNYLTANFENKICFPPYYAPNWYDDANANNTDFNGFVNAYNCGGSGSYLVNSGSQPHKYSIAPAIYVFYILKKIFETDGYSLNGNAWNDEELRSLILFSYRALDTPEAHYHSFIKFAQVQQINNALSGTTGVQLQPVYTAYPDLNADGNWNNTTHDYNILGLGAHVVVVTLVIKFPDDYYLGNSAGSAFLRLCLDGVSVESINILDGVGVTITRTYSFSYTAVTGDINKKLSVEVGAPNTDGSGFALSPNFAVTTATTVDIINNDTLDINVFNNYVKLKEHMPDWKCSEFVEAFKTWACVKFDIDDYKKIVYINFVENTIRQQPVDVTSVVTTKPNYVLEDFEGIELAYNFGDTDTYAADGAKQLPSIDFIGFVDDHRNIPTASRPGQCFVFTPTNEVWVAANNLWWDGIGSVYGNRKIGTGKQRKELTFAPIFMGVFTMSGYTMVLPKIGEKCSSAMYEMGENNYTPRFAFYKGMSAQFLSGSTVYTGYPFATTSNTDIVGNKHGNYTFDLYRETSIIQWFHINYYEILLRGEAVEIDFAADVFSIDDINNWEKILNDYLEYLSKTITLTIQDNKIKGRITALRL
jgi:hypothetical protein